MIKHTAFLLQIEKLQQMIKDIKREARKEKQALVCTRSVYEFF